GQARPAKGPRRRQRSALEARLTVRARATLSQSRAPRSPCFRTFEGDFARSGKLMRTVIGLFDTIPEALYALDALKLRKYDRSDISVIADDLSQLHGAPANIVGVAAGSAFNVVAGLSAFGIPGVGPILAAPSLLAVLGEATASDDDPETDWLIR